MAAWREDVSIALRNLGGIANLSAIYSEVKKVRDAPPPQNFKASVRDTIERNSRDSEKGPGKDLFFSVEGIGEGVWGLREYEVATPHASDINGSEGNQDPTRIRQETYRILRDTALARKIKLIHGDQCQLCGETIVLSDGSTYSEAHHIKPLGGPHHGPDVPENIIVLCPNHHVMFDYGAITVGRSQIKSCINHHVGQKYLDYHNEVIAHGG